MGMDVMETVLTRRSRTRLTAPGPDDEVLLQLVQAAATAPDHGRLKPWRLVTIRGTARERLGEAFTRAADDPALGERDRGKPLRAPLLIAIVLCPQVPHPKVPEWEQLAAAVSVVQNLQLLLHSSGWGAIWRTGKLVDAPPVHECLGVRPGERLLGWLYVGKPQDTATVPPRDRFDVREKLSTLDSHG